MISLYGRLYEYIFIDSNLKDFSFIMIVFEGIFGNSWIWLIGQVVLENLENCLNDEQK